MFTWIIAIGIGVAVAFIAYGRSRLHNARFDVLLALLRAAAVALVAALLLRAPLAPPSPVAPIVAVDASASLRRTHDSLSRVTAYRTRAEQLIRDVGASQVMVFGDSVLEGDASLVDQATLSARRSQLRPVIDRAAALGRPVVVLSDGEVDDAAVFNDAPAGSRVVIDSVSEQDDAAVFELSVAAAAAAGDTLEATVSIGAGRGGAPRGELRLLIDGRVVNSVATAALEPMAVTTVSMRLPLPRATQLLLVQAALAVPNDAEPRNDTLGTIVEITDRPPVAFVSTSPDLDVREAVRVLRGALDMPVRTYLRIAPQLWREEGTLAAITETEVRSRAQRAGLVVVHGDTAWGDIARSARGARLLWTPAPPLPPARAGEVQRASEWYPVGAPPSPLTAPLAGLPWDSLPPITINAPARGEFSVLDVKLGRAGDATPAVAGRTSGNIRTIVVSGSGYAGWALRGGRPAEAFTAMWGAIFDWLAAARGDERAARPLVAQLREGEPVRWRRGGPDSVVSVVMRRRGATGSADTVQLRFRSDGAPTVTAPLLQGVYEVQAAGGASLLVVNPSREWLPATSTLRADARVPGEVTSDAPRLTDKGWPFILALLLLSAEWIGRRFAGHR